VTQDPSDLNAADLLRTSLYALGRAELEREHWTGAREAFDEMVAIVDVLHARGPGEWRTVNDLALSRTMQAVAEIQGGDVSRGVEHAEIAARHIAAALLLAPVGMRVAPPSYELQLATTLADALATIQDADPALARRARDFSNEILLSAEAHLRAFEPHSREAATHKSLLELAGKTRAKLDALAATDPE
jgi:hypothetical protein